MPKQFLRSFKKKVTRRYDDINPEDVFLDSANLPGLNQERFEGKMERPIGDRTFFLLRTVLVLIGIFLVGRLWGLEVSKGTVYATISEENRLEKTTIFADRGVIYDRNKMPLASNGVRATTSDFASRIYAPLEGLAPAVGYVKYPSKDAKGNYYDTSYHGQAGIEKVYNVALSGANGSKLTETDARGGVQSESAINPPLAGSDVTLALDANLTQEMYKAIEATALDKGFISGGGVIMDVRTGEILALTSYPDYSQTVMTEGTDQAEITRLLKESSNPFLNRVVSGLFTPGSIVKPIMALAAQNEHVIDPMKIIVSTGSISLPNPYDPSHPSIFKDWRANGPMTMRDAIALSSDVYFYEIGGGYQGQKGLGITNIDKYFTLFGLEEKTGIDLPAESTGTIATVDWKAKHFPSDPTWRIGDTYHTSIGQYGTQVTPLEAVRWVGAIANGGTLLVPSMLQGGISAQPGKTPADKVYRTIDLPAPYFQTVREGMRQGVAGGGVVASLNTSAVKIAGKTGTAELGAQKQFVNSWVTGFFPYDDPHYAFAVIMERGPVTNLVGAPYVMRQVVDWMAKNTPEYLK